MSTRLSMYESAGDVKIRTGVDEKELESVLVTYPSNRVLPYEELGNEHYRHPVYSGLSSG